MELIEIGGHTIAPSLLEDGVIIDVGCRGFEFTDYFKNKKVFAIDPDENVFKERPIWDGNNVTPMHCAISDVNGKSGIYINGEGTCLKEIDPDKNHPFVECETITMDSLYKFTGTNVDVLKLDCEGAEYIILGETFKPIPKQISVEFHYHCVPELHNKHIDSIMERLSKDYTVHNAIWEPRHGCGFNFWDVLFIRKY